MGSIVASASQAMPSLGYLYQKNVLDAEDSAEEPTRVNILDVASAAHIDGNSDYDGRLILSDCKRKIYS